MLGKFSGAHNDRKRIKPELPESRPRAEYANGKFPSSIWPGEADGVVPKGTGRARIRMTAPRRRYAAVPPAPTPDRPHPTDLPRPSTFQIVFAYCPMVLSDENWPMPATLRMALRTQACGSR